MKHILLLGSGGRESALAWKISQSPLCATFYIAPGNAGTAQYGVNLDLDPVNFEAVKEACIKYKIDILIPGPEEPLVRGIWDFFKADPALNGIVVIGPSMAGAQLEGSKAFSKKFMVRHQIPTAAYMEFEDQNFEQGTAYIKRTPPPYVVKADGLAAGKGVVITSDPLEAIKAFRSMIKDLQFGEAGKKVVIEEYLQGIELSVFVLTDGEHYLMLPEAKDYKRIGEGDTGPNTGGMGAISPAPFADAVFMEKVKSRIIKPTIAGLRDEGIDYQGFLFIGLMNVAGEPFVIEYNCRLGDPETEVVLPRLQNDLVELLLHMKQRTLDEVRLEVEPRVTATVMLVSGGYPGNYEKGKPISGLEQINGSIAFHAGTTGGQNVITAGGRVMALTSYGSTLAEALEKSYQNASRVDFEGKYYRKDIGWEFMD